MSSHINLSCRNIETFIIETRGIIASKNTFSEWKLILCLLYIHKKIKTMKDFKKGII
jgi:hypothetical protein